MTAMSLPHAHLRRAAAPSTSGPPPGCPAGSTASAITAICSSSTCATTTASPSACSTPASPGFAAAEPLRLESVISVTGKVVRAGAGGRQPQAGHRRGRGGGGRADRAVDGRAAAAPGQREAEYPEETRLRYRFLDLRREELHRNILLRSHVIASIRRRMIAGWLHRVPDADPDLELTGGRPRLSGAEPRAPRQVLRAAAGAPAVQAAADGGRLRPLLPDRARASATRTAAPTARPGSSTSSTSRCRS